MAKVLIISVVYEPDVVSTAGVAAGLARELHKLGHDVAVLSSVPHFNPPPEAAGVYRTRPWRPAHRSVRDGVVVYRCWSPRKANKPARRVWGFGALHAGMLLTTARHLRDRDVTIVISPPLTFALVGFLAQRLGRGVTIYNAQELWPDVPRDLGIITNRWLLGLLGWLERLIYRRSDAVVAIGPGFAVAIRERTRERANVSVIPNFVDSQWITPGVKDNQLARRWHLHDQPVVLYAGNVGLTQDFDCLLEAARHLEGDGVEVVIVGGGAGRPSLGDQVGAWPNVTLRDFVSREDVRDLYALADIVVVPLKAGHDNTTTPSKIFSAMAAARPVVVTAAAGTDVAVIVAEARAGAVVPPGDGVALAAALRKLLRAVQQGEWDPAPALSFARSLSPGAAAACYDSLISSLAPNVHRPSPAISGATPQRTRSGRS